MEQLKAFLPMPIKSLQSVPFAAKYVFGNIWAFQNPGQRQFRVEDAARVKQMAIVYYCQR